jgi:hypothetical protein
MVMRKLQNLLIIVLTLMPLALTVATFTEHRAVMKVLKTLFVPEARQEQLVKPMATAPAARSSRPGRHPLDRTPAIIQQTV